MAGGSFIRHRRRRAAVMLLLGAMLASCATTPPKQTASIPGVPPGPKPGGAGIYKVGNPYQVAGQWYYPQEQPGYDETGIASWYGSEFHGRLTSNGEIFDRNLVSAAHPTLPLPVNVRVTNLDNGRSLVVRVNDRGPFKKGRLIDLSEHAADLLGYRAGGTARVRVTFLGKAPLDPGGLVPPVEPTETTIATAVSAAPTPKVSASSLSPVPGIQMAALRPSDAMISAAPARLSIAPAPKPEPELTQVPVPAATAIYVQAGAFASLENANRVIARLNSVGAQLSPITRDGKPLYRVRIGPFQDVAKADAVLARIAGLGHNGAAIVVD
jgi:rare lipoprotein A